MADEQSSITRSGKKPGADSSASNDSATKRNRTKNISVLEAEVILSAMVNSQRQFGRGIAGHRFQNETWDYALEQWNELRESQLNEPPQNLKALKKFYSNVCAQVASCREALEGSPYENEDLPSEECKVYFLTTLRKAEHTFSKFVLYSKYLKLLGEKRHKEPDDSDASFNQSFNTTQDYHNSNQHDNEQIDPSNKKGPQENSHVAESSLSPSMGSYQPIQHSHQHQYTQAPQHHPHPHHHPQQYPHTQAITKNMSPSLASAQLVLSAKSPHLVGTASQPIHGHIPNPAQIATSHKGGSNPNHGAGTKNRGGKSKELGNNSGSNSSNSNAGNDNSGNNRVAMVNMGAGQYQHHNPTARVNSGIPIGVGGEGPEGSSGIIRTSHSAIRKEGGHGVGGSMGNMKQDRMNDDEENKEVMEPDMGIREQGKGIDDERRVERRSMMGQANNYSESLLPPFKRPSSSRNDAGGYKKAFQEPDAGGNTSSNVLEKVMSLDISYKEKKGFIRYLLHNTLAFNMFDKARTANSMMLLYEVYCDEQKEKAGGWG